MRPSHVSARYRLLLVESLIADALFEKLVFDDIVLRRRELDVIQMHTALIMVFCASINQHCL